MNGNWTSVFRRCNKALEFPINEKTADVNRLLKYLSLISCYETGEFELLKSRLRSFKRDATHKQPLSFREKASISYFTKLSTHPTPKKKKEILEKHIEEISTYKAKFRGEDHFEDLYYTEYLKASLSGKTVGETLKSLS